MTRGTTTHDGEPTPELLARARSGDRDAVGELLRQIHPLVHRWALVRTGDAADADDVAQEALVRVVRGLASFRGGSRFTSWLYRVVGNAAIDRGRRSRRRRERTEELEMLERGDRGMEGGARTGTRGPEHRDTGADDPGDAVDRDRLLDRVRTCYRSLTERQRQIFDLCELEGLDSGEAAERLGIAPSTVRVTLLKARRALREEILRSDPELVEAFLS